MAGVALFTLASLVNGIATSSGMLIAGRAAQGLGAALVSPAALYDRHDDVRRGARADEGARRLSAIAAGGGAVGLILGGVLTDALSWRWVFFVNLPIGIAAFVLAARYIPNTKADRAGDDRCGRGRDGHRRPARARLRHREGAGVRLDLAALGIFALALVLLGSFVIIELRSKAPLIRLGIFRFRALTTANIAMLLVISGLYGMFYFASIYVQEILGYSPIQAGFAFVPVTVGIVIGAALAQPLVARFGTRTVPVAGIVLAATRILLLSQIPTHGTYLADLLPGLVVMSIGMGLTFVPITLLATTGVQPADAGLASGIFNTSQQVGGALGLAILSSLAAGRTATLAAQGTGHEAALVDGFQLAFLVGAGLMLGAAVVILTMLRRHHVPALAGGEEVSVVPV